jgi:hypothetical protein
MLRVNEHVASKDYVVILLRTKKFKFEVKKKFELYVIAMKDWKKLEMKNDVIQSIDALNVLSFLSRND